MGERFDLPILILNDYLPDGTKKIPRQTADLVAKALVAQWFLDVLGCSWMFCGSGGSSWMFLVSFFF